MLQNAYAFMLSKLLEKARFSLPTDLTHQAPCSAWGKMRPDFPLAAGCATPKASR
jgi:hypothetical protein